MSTKSIDTWLQELNSEDPKVVNEAVRAIAYAGEEVIPRLIEAVRDKSSHFMGVCKALSAIGGPAVESLTMLLEENVTDVQMRVIYVLARIGDNRAVIPLVLALDDDDVEVRAAAAGALVNFSDPRAIKPLLKTLKNDPDVEVRANAARSLDSYPDDRVTDALLEALKEPNFEVRRGAIWSLATFKVERVRKALEEAVNDPDIEVRQLAAAALREHEGDHLALERLEAAERHVTEDVKDLIETIKKGPHQQIPNEALRNSNPRVRARLLEELGSTGAEYAVGVIIPGLSDINPAVRATAMEQLKRIGQKAYKPLLQHLDNEQRYMRSGAIVGLAIISGEDALDPIIGKLADPEPLVRRKAVNVLATMGNERGIAAIKGLRKDPDEKVRETVQDVLEKLGESTGQDGSSVSRFLRRIFRGD